MTVSALITRNDITATASQTVFIYTFRVIEATDMAVYQNGVLLSSGYTVTGVNNTTGGTVVLDTGVPAGQIVSLVLAMPLDRTTNYQNSGKFLADDVNEDFDKIYIGAIQNENLNDRSLRLKDVEPPTTGVDMTIPLKADRLGKFLSFNATTGAPEVSAGTGADAYDSAAWSAYNFTGNGSTTAFVLGIVPHSENNTQVYIDGVYQQKDGYSLSGSTITFSAAPPNLSTIEVMVTASLPVGSTSSDLVSYLPSGTGAVATTVQTKLRESVSVKDFGAVGDGVTDDTLAIQTAINVAAKIILPEGTYKVIDTLTLKDNTTFQGDGVGLTIINYASSSALSSGALLLLDGADNAYVSDLSITHSLSASSVSGIKIIGESYNVKLERLDVSGFSTNFFLDGALGAVGGKLKRCSLTQCCGHDTHSGYGIRVQNTASLLIQDCNFYSNTLDGIKLRALNDNTRVIGGQSYSNGTGPSNGNGIDTLSSGYELTIDGLECYSNDGAGIYCKTDITLSPTLGVTRNISIVNCVSHNNSGDGIQLTRNSGGTNTDYLLANVQVLGGRYYSNGANGLTVGRSRNVNVTGGSFYNNDNVGISVVQAIDVNIGNVFIVHNCINPTANPPVGLSISQTVRFNMSNSNINGSDCDTCIIQPSDYSSLTPTHKWAVQINLTDSANINLDNTVQCSNYIEPQPIYITGTHTAGTAVIVDQTGTGAPENVQYGGIGSIFRRSDGAGSTSMYVKESGVAKTGWVAK